MERPVNDVRGAPSRLKSASPTSACKCAPCCNAGAATEKSHSYTAYTAKETNACDAGGAAGSHTRPWPRHTVERGELFITQQAAGELARRGIARGDCLSFSPCHAIIICPPVIYMCICVYVYKYYPRVTSRNEGKLPTTIWKVRRAPRAAACPQPPQPARSPRKALHTVGYAGVPGILLTPTADRVGVDTAGSAAAAAIEPPPPPPPPPPPTSAAECGVAGTEPDTRLPADPSSAHTVDSELFLLSV